VSRSTPATLRHQRARLDALEARADALKRKCQTGYACGSTCIDRDKDCARQSGAAAEGLRQRIKGYARRLLGRTGRTERQPPPSAASATAAAARIQAMAAARRQQEREQQQRDEEMLSRPPRPWAVKRVEHREQKDGDAIGWHDSRFEVQLERPLRLPVAHGKGSKVYDRLSFSVAVEPANAAPVARQLLKQGVSLPREAVASALELGWATGAGGSESLLTAERLSLPQDVARRFSREISKQVKALVSRSEEGQIVLCSAYDEDGAGEKRQSLYKRAGFTFIDGVGVAVVRNGKLSRIEGARGDRQDAADEINLDDLIYKLLTLEPADR